MRFTAPSITDWQAVIAELEQLGLSRKCLTGHSGLSVHQIQRLTMGLMAEPKHRAGATLLDLLAWRRYWADVERIDPPDGE